MIMSKSLSMHAIEDFGIAGIRSMLLTHGCF